MWKRGKWTVLFLLVFLLSASSYNTKVYMKQGGDEQVVADGGKVTVESGGEITLETGGVLGTAGTATIAGILHSNLVDKSAEEDIAGKWTFSDLVASDTCVLNETSFSDSDITNVGDIALDSITADDGSSFAISSDWTNAGNTVADLGTVTTMDADGGTIDGATIGAATPSTGAFSTLAASGAGTLHETTFSDSDITNVGDIALDTITADDGSSFKINDAAAFGSWGYEGEHIALTDSSSNTNAGLGEYFEISSVISAGKVMAGEYSRLVCRTAQTNQCTLVGTESQFRLRNVSIADGVHAGLWAYAEQSGTTTLSGGGTFDAISATVESEAGFTVGATEHVTGITIDSSINAAASIDGSANFSGIYIKSNGKDWFTGIKITGATTDMEMQNGLTLSNATNNQLIITENSEDLNLAFASDAINLSSSTGVTSVDWGTIGIDDAAIGATTPDTGVFTTLKATEHILYLSEIVTSDTDLAVTVANSGAIYTNDGASAAVTFTLPTAAAGLTYTFTDVEAGAGSDLTIQAAADDTINGGTASKAYECTTDTVKHSVTLVAIDAVQWIVISECGTWANNNS